MATQFTAAVAVLALLLALPAGGPRAGEPGDSMAALVSAAKAEGSVIVSGPAIDVVRDALTQGFERAYGIQVTYISSGGGAAAARVRAERAAGKYLLDVLVSGPDSPLMTFLPGGWLDRIEPALIAPDVLNTKDWKDGHLWYADPQHTILRTIQYVTPELAINTKLVNPKELPTWKSLLDPKWKGKLLVKDPTTSGSGQSLTSFLYLTFGPDFVRKLYRDQQPVFTRDSRQASQWLAQGTYPIWVGTEFSTLETFKKAGYPIAAVTPTDGPGILTGSDGLISLMNRPPHPNAAKLYVNWIAGHDGGLLFAKALLAGSLRTDFKQDWMPSYEMMKPGVKYYDAYEYKFVTVERDAALAKVRDLLGF
jgi:iron(III) transport system substrate-binding protein